MHGGGGVVEVVDYWIIGLSRFGLLSHVELFGLVSTHHSITPYLQHSIPSLEQIFRFIEKGFGLIGLSLPCTRSLNSWSLAFCADERWSATSDVNAHVQIAVP